MTTLAVNNVAILNDNPLRRESHDAVSRTHADLPAWKSQLHRDLTEWNWKDQRLIHKERPNDGSLENRSGRLQHYIVNRFYATHKNSKQVSHCIERLLAALPKDGWGLNLGSGDTTLHPRVINLDVQDSPSVDILTWGTKLPFADNSLDLIISQEVLEHIDDPWHTVREVHRVLRPGGKFYCQVPFIIGFHPGPSDYWRFSRQGLAQMFEAKQWTIEELEPSLGHGSGFYRILVEFAAVTCSVVSEKLYKPAKGAAALCFYPVTWLDRITHYSQQHDRIPGGYYCVAIKK